MALPSSGQISMSQINTELGRSSTANISLSTAETGGYGAINQCSPSRPDGYSPYTMNEWHGYNHTINCCGGSTCYSFSVYIAAGVGCSSVCGQTPNTTIYTCSSALNPGVNFSFNSNCQAPGSTYSGAMTDGTYCYTFTGFNIDTKTSCATTTTTTAAPSSCHNYQATASSFMLYTDCCGVAQSVYLLVGDTFCAQIGTVYGYYVDLGTSCNC